MNEQLTTHKAQNSALAVMAARFAVEPLKLLSTLKSTVFKNATDDELLALVVVANEYGLNPLTKEIYAFPAKGGGIVPVISIDGWVNRMNSNDKFDGIEFEDEIGDDGKPVKVTATIWRKDRSKPIKVTEYYAECKRNTEPWNTMPCRMLRHKALCQCVRVAFGFGGVYDEDEARDVTIRDVTPLFPASRTQSSGGASGGGGGSEPPGNGPTHQNAGKQAKKGVAVDVPRGIVSGTNEPPSSQPLPGVRQESSEGADDVRGLPPGLHGDVSEGEPADTGATPEAERSPLRGGVSGAGEDQAGTLPGLRGEGSDAPRGLQQAAGSGVAVSEASSLASQLKELLDAQGVTEAQALEVCRRNRIPVGDTLAASPVKSIRLLLKDVKTLVSESKK